MKTTAIYPAHKPLSYPNAATSQQLWGKFLDFLLVAVSGMGIAASVLLLLCI